MRLTSETTSEELYPHLLGALRAWHSSTPEHLLDFLLLVRENRGNLPEQKPNENTARRRITNEVLLTGIESLERRDPENAEILRRRFVRKETILQVAFGLNFSEDQVNRRQKQAVLGLGEVLLAREMEHRRLRIHDLEIRLPTRQYNRLYGINASVVELSEKLLPGAPPWMISLTGMGGIGKTALAHFLALQSVSDYSPETILWVRITSPPGIDTPPEETYLFILNELAAQLNTPEGSPDARRARVLRVLRAQAYLVVIDNVERESDTAYLVENLSGQNGPGKFLVTTRSGMIGASGIFNYRVPELGFENASALITDHSQSIGMGEAAISEEKDLRAVFDAVGGNPLALKMIVGQTARLPLPVVLNDLAKRRLAQTDEMFTRVFEQAWAALSTDARELLGGMPLVAETGAASGQLIALSGLPEGRFWAAIQELLACSLLESYGTATERRYGIHHLTRAFLHAQLDKPE